MLAVKTRKQPRKGLPRWKVWRFRLLFDPWTLTLVVGVPFFAIVIHWRQFLPGLRMRQTSVELLAGAEWRIRPGDLMWKQKIGWYRYSC